MPSINDGDFLKINERIKKDARISSQIKSWLQNNQDCFKEFCRGIENGWNRGAFLKVLTEAIAEQIDNQPQNSDEIDADEVFVSIRRSLNGFRTDDGSTITPRRGQFGGLYLLPAIADQNQITELAKNVDAIVKVEKEQEETDKQERELEKNFYPLVQKWAVENGYEQTKITGGKLPGFKWENPDLIEVQYSVGEFTRSIDFGITCFEVKLKVEPFGVWQAAHYRKFSREVYIAFAKSEADVRERDNGRIFDMAVELGIGVLALNKQRDAFIQIHAPAQSTPALSEINLVISRFQGLYKDQLQKASDDLRRALEIPRIIFEK